MLAMVLRLAARRARLPRRRRPGPRRRPGAGAGARLRRLPHRSARRRRRAAGRRAPRSSPATRSSAPSRRSAPDVDALRAPASASACRGSAGRAARAASAAPAARTSATRRASPATTIDGGYAEYARRRRALSPSRSRTRYSDARGGAAAVRRADRLPGAARSAGDGASGSASTASAPPRTSWRRSRATRAARSTPSRAPATRRRRRFARELGAAWAGDSRRAPPEPLDAAIIFAPVGALVPARARAPSQGRRRSSAPAST